MKYFVLFMAILFLQGTTLAKQRDLKFKHGLSFQKDFDAATGADRITFLKDQKKTSCIFLGEEGKSFFHDMEELNVVGYPHSIFVSSWSWGAHGECLILFDPLLKDCVLKRFESGHPLDYEAEGDHLNIVYSIFDSHQEKTDEKVEQWRPTEFRENNP